MSERDPTLLQAVEECRVSETAIPMMAAFILSDNQTFLEVASRRQIKYNERSGVEWDEPTKIRFLFLASDLAYRAAQVWQPGTKLPIPRRWQNGQILSDEEWTYIAPYYETRLSADV